MKKSINNKTLAVKLADLLSVDAFDDYVPNGLQVEGKPTITKIVTGVTASQWLIERAINEKADALIVHHGYFWRNESPVLTGIKYRRIKSLIAHDINLYAYHLPLDAHCLLGNNKQLADKLAITQAHACRNDGLLWQGEFTTALTGEALRERIETVLHHAVLHCGDNAKPMIKRVAWCTGGGQHFIEQAIELGVDAFISGEVSEQTIHIARESGIHFYAAGHHATERYGIKALGEWIAEHAHLDVTFIDIDNPA